MSQPGPVSIPTKRLTPGELEWAYTTLVSKNVSLSVLGQAHFIIPDNGEFSCYLIQNENEQRTLLFQPVYVRKNDEPTAVCGLSEVLNFYLQNLTSLKCEQILIPIPEVGSYPFITRRSLHFVLLHIRLDENGKPVSSVTMDSNPIPLLHPRIDREPEIESILNSTLSTGCHQGRRYFNVQALGDNISCGYFVYYFLQSLLIKPNIKFMLTQPPGISIWQVLLSSLGYLPTDTTNCSQISNAFCALINSLNQEGALEFDRLNGVFNPSLFSEPQSNMGSASLDNVLYTCYESKTNPSHPTFSQLAPNITFEYTKAVHVPITSETTEQQTLEFMFPIYKVGTKIEQNAITNAHPPQRIEFKI